MDPNIELFEGCRTGNMVNINNAIKRGAYDFDRGFDYACLNGHMNIIIKMIELGVNKYDFECYGLENHGLSMACRGGHMDAINKMIELGATKFEWGLSSACRGGHINAVNRMIEIANLKGGLCIAYFDLGLAMACKGGHMNAINKMIEMGATDFNRGLNNACRGGQMNVINKMIEMAKLNGSLNKLEFTLLSACYNGHMDAINKMIEMGADDFNIGLEYACKGEHMKIVEKMIELGGKFENKEDEKKYEKWKRDKDEFTKIFSYLLCRDISLEIVAYL
jgi:ankyrin repeat protein